MIGEKKTNRTVMICLAGDNNLTEEMVWAFKELTSWKIQEAALATPSTPLTLNVVAQFDPNGVGVPTRRYDFAKVPVTGDPAYLESWAVGPFQLGETNTGNLTPAAALREAQLSMSRERQWSFPFYASALSLQGDWK